MCDPRQLFFSSVAQRCQKVGHPWKQSHEAHQQGSRNFPVTRKDGIEVEHSIKKSVYYSAFITGLVKTRISPHWNCHRLRCLSSKKCGGLHHKNFRFFFLLNTLVPDVVDRIMSLANLHDTRLF